MLKQITAKDIKTFGVVLEALAQKIQTNPELILNIIEIKTEQPAKKTVNTNKKKDINSDKVNNFSLFEMARALTEAELVAKLNTFTVEELKYMIKRYHLGTTNKRKKEYIIEFIVDHARKRAVDIFREHD